MDGPYSDDSSRSYPDLSPPLLSFILPVYNAAGYLKECLNGITQQAFRDIEIIAVDGASTDCSADILDKIQQNEPRLTVIRMHDRIGPGKARNLGAQQAQGEYLWFVDADDTVVAESLTSIVHSLKFALPDVLLVGYELVYPRGRVEAVPVGGLNNHVNATCFTVAEHPQALNVSLASWNKVIRKDYFDSLQAEFSLDWPHEDVGVSCKLLLNASKLSILDQICYRYRKDRPGASMVAGERYRHFKVFDVWRQVLADAQAPADAQHPMLTAEVYRTLFERAIEHCSTQLETGGLGVGRVGLGGYVARRDRRRFFKDLGNVFSEFVPPDYVRPHGFRGIKFGLIQRRDYWLYALLDPPNKLLNAVRTTTAGRGPTA